MPRHTFKAPDTNILKSDKSLRAADVGETDASLERRRVLTFLVISSADGPTVGGTAHGSHQEISASIILEKCQCHSKLFPPILVYCPTDSVTDVP